VGVTLSVTKIQLGIFKIHWICKSEPGNSRFEIRPELSTRIFPGCPAHRFRVGEASRKHFLRLIFTGFGKSGKTLYFFNVPEEQRAGIRLSLGLHPRDHGGADGQS